MRDRWLVLVLLLACAGWLPAAASPILPWPDPGYCTVPGHLVVCPAGDALFAVTIAGPNGPVPGCGVLLDFSACAGLQLCPDCCAGVITDPVARTAYAVTDDYGRLTLALRAGGVCNGSVVGLYAVPYPPSTTTVLVANLPLSSPDQDGDFDVDDADALAVELAIGTVNWGADFDADGLVTSADLAWLTDGHGGGHVCSGVVPARRATWGSLKLLYR